MSLPGWIRELVLEEVAMRDIEFYAQVLGLVDPWFVDDVDLSIENRRVDICVSHHEGRLWACPKCQVELPVFDHAEERAWRHLDTGGFPTWLHACPPRVRCPTDGVRQVHLPWAEPRSRFTRAFERFAIDVMKETDISGASNILKASWDECWGIMERAVARGRAAKEHQVPALIGVDEKAARKGHFSGVSDPCGSVAGGGLLRGWCHTLWIPCATCRTVSHIGKFRADVACRADRHAGLLDGGRRRLAASPVR